MPPPLATVRASILTTLRYADRFDYPLTGEELYLWQITIKKSGLFFSRSEIGRALGMLIRQGSLVRTERFIALKDRKEIGALRLQREAISRKKWVLARQFTGKLAKIPTVEMIAVTGSLAMNNGDRDGDIDLLILTKPYTLWLTRFVVWLVLLPGRQRRQPQLSTPEAVRDKVCDNLYLEPPTLSVIQPTDTPQRRVFVAHELLQASPVYDRCGWYGELLRQNRWAAEDLPVAYRERLDRAKPLYRVRSRLFWLTGFLYPLNLLFFMVQYLYMKPKVMANKITLTQVFFHPKIRTG
jgi:predicted nucleotidyltransferase